MNREQLERCTKGELVEYLRSQGIPVTNPRTKAELIQIAMGGPSYAEIKQHIRSDLDTDTHSDRKLSAIKQQLLKEEFTLSTEQQNQLTKAEKKKYKELRDRLVVLFKKHDAAWEVYNERAHLEPDNMELLWRIQIVGKEIKRVGDRLKKNMV